MSYDLAAKLQLVVEKVVEPHLAEIAAETSRTARASVEVSGNDEVGAVQAVVNGPAGGESGDPLSHRARVEFRETGDPTRLRFHVQIMLDQRLEHSSYSGLEAAGAITETRDGNRDLKLTSLIVLNNVWEWVKW
jgi:hypothetical protein